MKRFTPYKIGKQNALPMSALLIIAMLSSCVGGPSEYFRNVAQESGPSTTAQMVDPQQTVEVASVASSDLPQAGQPADQQQLEPAEQAPIGQPLIITNNDELLTTGLPPQPELLSSAYAAPDTTNANIVPLPTISGVVPDSGFAIGLPTVPVIDPLEAAAEARIPLLYSSMEHGQCAGGRGPVPKSMGAKKVNPSDPYYIEIRMRNTPLLPVGHTYVAYGKLRGDGEILDENLIMLAPFGGYAGAALASGIPVPGVLSPHPDDCRIRPETAYRVSLNAQRYELLLNELRQARADKPAYLLFAYNCNHFATRIAQSVGIRPPKNIYVPAVEYLYAMIEENEGRKVARN